MAVSAFERAAQAAMHPTGTPRVIDWLMARKLLTAEQRASVVQRQQSEGGRFEEAVLACTPLGEGPLLKCLAAGHRTRFVSTEKLAKARVDEGLLMLVPRSVAEREGVFPLLLDAARKTLTVATADPQHQAALERVRRAARVERVQALVARPRGVLAAIARHYAGDIQAFARLEGDAGQAHAQQIDVFEQSLQSATSVRPTPAEAVSNADAVSEQERQDLARESVSAELIEPQAQLAQVLVALHEASGALRGHSARVAALMVRVAERIGLEPAQVAALRLAGLLHELGAPPGGHLTALGVGTKPDLRSQAASSCASPLRLLESVTLPATTTEALGARFERFDGGGLPAGTKERQIPLGARLLAIADSFVELTDNPQNPFRRRLDSKEAGELLARYVGSLFDPNLVELLRLTLGGEDLRSRLLTERTLVLVVEPDPEEGTVLELRLIERGFDARVVRDATSALRELARGEVQAVVSELRLQPGQDGLALLEKARQEASGRALPWLLVASAEDQSTAPRAFELGADDFLTKPISSDLLVTKLAQVLARQGAQSSGRGASGSLEEMGLVEIVQVLWHGRKTGALRLSGPGGSGEIHFVDGHVYQATCGELRGAPAFYALVGLKRGQFSLDPSHRAEERHIDASPEALLLESMRLLDESAA